VRFTVTIGGHVLDAYVRSTTLRDPGVERCVTGAVRSWRFPALPNSRWSQVGYPFVFQQSRSPGRRR